jgi:hypothetical protein
VAGSSEYGDEPSGSGAMQLVIHDTEVYSALLYQHGRGYFPHLCDSQKAI